MNYTLMHKAIPVAELTLNEATGSIQHIDGVLHGEHLPAGVSIRRGIADRSGLREALEAMGLPNSQLLLSRCYGLSLSDHYWIKPAGSGLTWHDVNFFENSFSEDVGDALFGIPAPKVGFDFSSPDNTSDGFLIKRWKILDGKRCLIQACSLFNEVMSGTPKAPQQLRKCR